MLKRLAAWYDKHGPWIGFILLFVLGFLFCYSVVQHTPVIPLTPASSG